MGITLTEKAIGEITVVMNEQQMKTDEYALEVGVIGGGCSGFSYKMGFKKKAEIDKMNETSFQFGDIETVVHNRALPFLEGVKVDYHTDINRRGFVFDNPNSKGSCGCGSSFSV
jgi:iron-sulfur cluster assembly protein